MCGSSTQDVDAFRTGVQCEPGYICPEGTAGPITKKCEGRCRRPVGRLVEQSVFRFSQAAVRAANASRSTRVSLPPATVFAIRYTGPLVGTLLQMNSKPNVLSDSIRAFNASTAAWRSNYAKPSAYASLARSWGELPPAAVSASLGLPLAADTTPLLSVLSTPAEIAAAVRAIPVFADWLLAVDGALSVASPGLGFAATGGGTRVSKLGGRFDVGDSFMVLSALAGPYVSFFSGTFFEVLVNSSAQVGFANVSSLSDLTFSNAPVAVSHATANPLVASAGDICCDPLCVSSSQLSDRYVCAQWYPESANECYAGTTSEIASSSLLECNLDWACLYQTITLFSSTFVASNNTVVQVYDSVSSATCPVQPGDLVFIDDSAEIEPHIVQKWNYQEGGSELRLRDVHRGPAFVNHAILKSGGPQRMLDPLLRCEQRTLENTGVARPIPCTLYDPVAFNDTARFEVLALNDALSSLDASLPLDARADKRSTESVQARAYRVSVSDVMDLTRIRVPAFSMVVLSFDLTALNGLYPNVTYNEHYQPSVFITDPTAVSSDPQPLRPPFAQSAAGMATVEVTRSAASGSVWADVYPAFGKPVNSVPKVPRLLRAIMPDALDVPGARAWHDLMQITVTALREDVDVRVSLDIIHGRVDRYTFWDLMADSMVARLILPVRSITGDANLILDSNKGAPANGVVLSDPVSNSLSSSSRLTVSEQRDALEPHVAMGGFGFVAVVSRAVSSAWYVKNRGTVLPLNLPCISSSKYGSRGAILGYLTPPNKLTSQRLTIVKDAAEVDAGLSRARDETYLLKNPLRVSFDDPAQYWKTPAQAALCVVRGEKNQPSQCPVQSVSWETRTSTADLTRRPYKLSGGRVYSSPGVTASYYYPFFEVSICDAIFRLFFLRLL